MQISTMLMTFLKAWHMSNNSMLQYSTIEFASPEYDLAIKLRDKILRKPLNISFNAEDLAEEWDQIHIGGFDELGKLLSVLVLKPVDEATIKMRQVAVDDNQQGKGYGKSMVEYSEAWAKHNGYSKMELHARDNAIPFYLSLDYKKLGKEFKEVGIPHFKMSKKLK